MTYIVLARKWRPQRFADLVGQEPIVRTLQNAISLQRVSHALLMTGTRGVGKTTTARIVAKALNCEKGLSAEPCGECSNCREIAAGTNVDVLEIDGASNTHVEDVRELIEKVRYTPSKSRHKIYIIDEVHMLSKSAFNALLKTLEEPPQGVIFIFATTEPQKIPDTILSRCQRFDFTEISEERMIRHLRTIADQEKIEITDSALALVARQASGSLRDALSALDRILAFSGSKITDDDAASILGLTDRTLIARTLESFVAHDGPSAVSALGEVLARGYDPKTYLLELWEKVRDLLMLKAGADSSLIHSTQEDLDRLKKWSGELEESEVERWFELLRRASGEIGRSEFPRYLMEMTFLRATRQEPRVPLSELVERLESLEGRLSKDVAPPSRTPPSGGDRPREVPPKPETARGTASWEGLVEAVKRQKPAVAAILLQAIRHEIRDGLLVLEFEEGSFYVSRAQDRDFAEYVSRVAGELFGGTYGVDVRTRERVARTTENPGAVDRARQREALEHPAIQKAVSLFGAKVEEIKPVK